MKKALVAALLIIAAIPLLIAVSALPPHGDPNTPVQTRVSARYLEAGVEEAGAENIVTGVILNYRGLDTAGEVSVIFTSLAAGLAVLIPVARSRSKRGADAKATPASPVVHFIVRLAAPFIALFAVYVILNGHVSPGGGFQGGAILGGLFIALSVVVGAEKMRALLPEKLAPWLHVAAPVTFACVGFVGIALTGVFLGYPRDEALHAARQAMLLALEIGIGIGGAAIFATLFTEMEAQP